MSIRAAEEAVDQAKLLSGAIERLAADLAAADQALAAGVAELDRDVQTARSLNTESTNAIADRVAAEAADIRSSIGRPGRDPLALQTRLEQVDAEIDAAVQGARDAAEQAARAQAQLERSLATARAQVHATEDYLVARRGAVGAEARTRLAEAGRLLVQAEAAAPTDPAGALTTAQRADQLARSAMSLAQQDVGGFSGGMGGGFGGSGGGGAAATSSARCSAASSSTRSSAAEAAAASAAAVRRRRRWRLRRRRRRSALARQFRRLGHALAPRKRRPFLNRDDP